MHKILIIEDNPTMLSLLKTLLELEGYHVSIAAGETVGDILNSIHQENPDIALLDVYLKDISGMDVVKQLRQTETSKHTTVIMTSGMNLEEQCLKEGADGFLLKPYMPDDLISLLKRTLIQP
jgi:CheY-like chemotaxis protein